MIIRTYPFGWLTPYLVPILHKDPARLDQYLSMSRADWHYFGLIISLMGDAALCPKTFATIEREAFVRPRLEVLRDLWPDHARPLLKLVAKLAGDLWRPPSYHRLALLTLEPSALDALRQQKTVHRRLLRALSRVPDELRHDAVLRRINRPDEADRVVFLVEIVRRIRPDMTTDDVLRSLAQTKEGRDSLHEWAAGHYQRAPFPEAPWAGTDCLRPITDYASLKKLALEFDNCVRNYLEEVLDGRSYFYRYAPAGKPVATVELEHFPKVGWCVGDIEGPGNKTVAGRDIGQINRHFSRAGIGVMPKQVDRYSLFRSYG